MRTTRQPILRAAKGVLACGAAFAAALVLAAPPALELVSTVSLDGVKGRIDHFSADPQHHRIFVAALGNDTVEAIDTRDKRRATISGASEPQGVLYLADVNRLFIANGNAGRLDVVDPTSLAVLHRIEGLEDADNLRYEPRERHVIVGYGKGALRFVDPANGESAGEITLPGHPESFQLERDGDRIFVNVPSARAVVVVDRSTRRTVARWPTPGTSQNFPMALDERDGRLFVGARSPAVLLVYDVNSGNIVARVPTGKDTDDIYFDDERRQLYVICGEGRIDVIRQHTPDRYALEESIATAPRARTGLFVPEERTLYVAAPASGTSAARVLAYRAN